jgi:type I restriction-modification system DNA methylase subunit
MIFTGCLLVEAIHGNINIRNISTVNHLRTQIVNTLKDLNVPYITEKEIKLNHLINKFKAVIFNEPKPQDVKTLVSLVLELKNITHYSQNTSSVDIMNIFFNEFGRKASKQEHGQVFTPDHISHLMAKLLDLNNKDNILDPTCGSGALLIKAMFEASSNLNPTEQKIFFNKNVFGIEYDENIVCLTYINMLLHQDGITNIRRADSLLSDVGD